MNLFLIIYGKILHKLNFLEITLFLLLCRIKYYYLFIESYYEVYMKILLTGATGYIGKRLLPILVENGHEVICIVRDKSRFSVPINSTLISVIEFDFLSDSINTDLIPKDIDVAYYLMHSMSASIENFINLESKTALNFRKLIETTHAKQIIYLSGIVNNDKLSKHLKSRKNVEDILAESSVALTTLRAGIIVGSGSASFEIIRDLVEKLPVMITPKWLHSKCQPIAIRDVISFLTSVIDRKDTFNKSFDIGGPEVLTYKEMLLQYAEVRKLKRLIITVPVMSPRISSYWLYFISSTTFKLALNLVDSLKIDVICNDNSLAELLNIKPISYKKAVEYAFDKIEQNSIVSSWKDALITSSDLSKVSQFINIPEFGCFIDAQSVKINSDPELALERIWGIGGKNGWYYANFLWAIRGFLDKLSGGVGLRRGRRDEKNINAGDALDFWRVIIADKNQKRLLLHAEMKLPGEAWLEFKITGTNDNYYLNQKATFRPSGLFGRLYWYSLVPFHFFIFREMAKKIAK